MKSYCIKGEQKWKSQPKIQEKAIDIGTLKLGVDAKSVDELIVRLERSIAAFKQEWYRNER